MSLWGGAGKNAKPLATAQKLQASDDSFLLLFLLFPGRGKHPN